MILFYMYSWIIFGIIIYAISKNKKGDYLKLSFFSAIVLSIIAALEFLSENKITQYNISIICIVVSLLGYIICQADFKK